STTGRAARPSATTRPLAAQTAQRACSPLNRLLRQMQHKCLILYLTIRAVLLQESKQVFDVFVVLDAGEYHFCVRDLLFWILDVVLECRFVPRYPRILVSLGILIALDTPSLPPDQAVQLWSHEVFRAFANLMARSALVEHHAAGFNI